MQQVVHLTQPVTPAEVERAGKAEADLLRPYRGRFVGRLDGQIVAVGDTPHEVFAQLREGGVKGAAIFRVPLDPSVDLPGTTA